MVELADLSTGEAKAIKVKIGAASVDAAYDLTKITTKRVLSLSAIDATQNTAMFDEMLGFLAEVLVSLGIAVKGEQIACTRDGLAQLPIAILGAIFAAVNEDAAGKANAATTSTAG